MGKRYVVTSLLACLAGYAAGASAAGPAAEPAAVLRQPQGKVFISQNSATVLAQDGMPLYAGNRVIAVSGGRAEVVYADDCVVALPENSLLSVKEIGSYALPLPIETSPTGPLITALPSSIPSIDGAWPI